MDTHMNTAAAAAPALVALDWGTSSLRAFLMDARGEVLAEHSSNRGIRHLAQPGDAGFAHALAEIAGAWMERWPEVPLVACGMVGSAQGWREAPYVACPADTGVLAGRAGRIANALGRTLLVAPGLLYEPAGRPPDVMRGEEIQIAGALALRPDCARRSCIVLPGTHSKWAWIEDGRITGFRTAMTGELYAVLRGHSLLGQLMPQQPAEDAAAAEAAFAEGLAQACDSRPGDLPHQIFATRTLGLTGRLPAPVLADYLSGLLIGHELLSGLAHLRDLEAAGGEALPIVLVGDAALSRRYAGALADFGRPPVAQLGNTAPQGLFRFARSAGLIDTPAPATV